MSIIMIDIVNYINDLFCKVNAFGAFVGSVEYKIFVTDKSSQRSGVSSIINEYGLYYRINWTIL